MADEPSGSFKGRPQSISHNEILRDLDKVVNS